SGRRTCRTALAHLLDRPGNVRGRQVVEQHPVRHLTGQAQHRRVERPDHDLGDMLPARDMLLAPTAARDMLPAPTAACAGLAGTNAEAEALDLVEVAREVDLLAGQAG